MKAPSTERAKQKQHVNISVSQGSIWQGSTQHTQPGDCDEEKFHRQLCVTGLQQAARYGSLLMEQN